jgi:hypothetical protein
MNAALESVKPEVDRTIQALNAKRFTADPIAGAHFSKIVSLLSSAYKRHGFIIERGLLATLQQHEHLEVWEQRDFGVSLAADSMVDHLIGRPAEASTVTLSYGEQKRTLQVDLFVYHKETKVLRSDEVKRGFGLHDSGKRRSILRDLLCLQVLTKGYGEARGLEIAEAYAHIIFYYGQCSIKKPFSLVREELDAHFGVPVVDSIEAINAYFQAQLFRILSGA